jgi:hypothetical protein
MKGNYWCKWKRQIEEETSYEDLYWLNHEYMELKKEIFYWDMSKI